MNRTVRYILIGLLVVTAIVAAILLNSPNATSPQGKTRDDAGSPVTVNAMVAHAEQFSESLSLTGEVLPAEQVEVYPEINGRVVSIAFREGDKVSAGQVLVKLDDAQQRAGLQKLLAQFSVDSAQLQRLESLRTLDGVSLADLDAARAKVHVRKAEIAEATSALEKTTIRAPFNGRAGLRMISVGAVVSPQTRLTTIADVASLKVDVSIPDNYAYAVHVGSMLNCVAQNNQGTDTVRATVYAAEPGVDQATRTLRVRARITSPAALVPGTMVDVVLKTSAIPHAILVPSESIQLGMKGASVYVLQGGIAHEVPVKLGGRTASRVHILTGVNNGDTVATSGLLALKQGQAIRVALTQ